MYKHNIQIVFKPTFYYNGFAFEIRFRYCRFPGIIIHGVGVQLKRRTQQQQ